MPLKNDYGDDFMSGNEYFNQDFEEICVCEANAQAMEDFLLRNQIPYSMEAREQREVVFSVRAGFDYRDTMIFVLKMWGDLDDPEVVNQINNLVMERDYPEPGFEYELYGHDRIDCEFLGTFVWY